MLRIILYCFLFLFTSVTCFAQNHELDSLLTKLYKEKNDSVKVELLLQLSKKSTEAKRTQKAVVYGQKALQLASQNKSNSGILKSLLCIARAYDLSNSYDSAQFYFNILKIKSLELKAYGYEKEATDGLALLHYFKGNYNESLKLNYELLSKSELTQDTLMIARAYTSISVIYSDKGEQEKALDYSFKSIEVYEKLERKADLMSVYNNIGTVYDDQGNFVKALEYYLKALFLAKKINEKYGQTAILNNIAVIHEIQGRFKEALTYFNEAKVIAEEIQSLRELAFIDHNIGNLYIKLGKYDESRAYLMKSLDLRMQIGLECDVVMDYSSLGSLFFELQDFDSSYYYHKRALDKALACEHHRGIANGYLQLGKIRQKKSEHTKAIDLLNKALVLSIDGGLADLQKDAAEKLYISYKTLGYFKESLKFHELFLNLKDSLFNRETVHKLAVHEAEFKFEQEKQLIEYEKEKEQIKLKATFEKQEIEHKATYAGLVLASLLLLALLILFYLNKRTNTLLSHKNKEIKCQNQKILVQWELLEQHKTKLEKKVSELDLLNKEKNKLIGIVAHDLRSPLNQIKGLSHLIKMGQDTLSKEQEGYLTHIIQSSDRLTELINRILDVYAVEARTVNVKMQIGDVGEVVSQVGDSFLILAKEKNITIHQDVKLGRYFALYDKNYFIHVMENLISNALKFSLPGSSIYLKLEEKEGKVITVVQDEGPGLSEEDKKKLFGQFQKLSAKPTAGETSSGLGLSIVKYYIEAMQAEITVESELYKGSSFIISFDLVNIALKEE